MIFLYSASANRSTKLDLKAEKMNAMMESSLLSLQHIFDEAIKFDTWGQRLEAAEEYQK